MSNVENWVEMKGICKRFGGVLALDNASLGVRKGEIHALMGENGAGKSTLMKILAGSLSKDEGTISLGGKQINLKSPKDGIENGISIIYQELMLVGDLSVAENIFLDKLSKNKKIIDFKELRKKAQTYLDQIGFSNIRATDEVADLTVASQQVVEICKALSRNASVLILDEPTSVLSNNEVVHLFEVLRKLREDGVAIIYISHRLEEVMELCDRITIMRDGRYIDTVNTQDITKEQLANMMVGRELQDYYPPRESHIGPVSFKVENICVKGKVHNVSFEVHEGEVLGINGLVGAGRTEAIRAIFGEDKRDSGKIYLNGKEIAIHNPRNSIRHGIGLLPEDRKTQGVLLELPIRNNITLGCLKQFKTAFWKLSGKKETEYVNDMIEQLSIKVGSMDDDVSSLSGGNQQKVAIAKLLASDCKVLLLDEPTRGVDVGAKREIYKIINEFAAKKYSIVMISSEMQEIMGMCDRVVIMRNGEIKGELKREEFSEENLIAYSMGVK
jgi:ribose transport system ATP-binding protein